MPKKFFLGIGIVLIIIAISLNFVFFFNPITFRNDNITYLPYHYYKNPMTYSYWNFEGDSEVNLRSNDEIIFVYKELKKSNLIGTDLSENLGEHKGLFVINSGYNSNLFGEDIITVTEIEWYGINTSICSINGKWEVDGVTTVTHIYIEVTDELKDYLDGKFESLK